ncbi:hypothetical protein GCM10009549_37560 [Streptomyces thermoalcalitolerans]|uniref:Transposase n=1 Tax=Streptomyces thermoalcalitolerans TaxID=65605 RepID=A0ABN1NYB9_9ACTN
MHDDERAVLAQVQIEFDDIQAGLLGGDEGTKGVLGLDTHDSAVTDGKEVQDSTRFRRRRLGAARSGQTLSARQCRSLVARRRVGTPRTWGSGVTAGVARGHTGRRDHPGVGESSRVLTAEAAARA